MRVRDRGARALLRVPAGRHRHRGRASEGEKGLWRRFLLAGAAAAAAPVQQQTHTQKNGTVEAANVAPPRPLCCRRCTSKYLLKVTSARVYISCCVHKAHPITRKTVRLAHPLRLGHASEAVVVAQWSLSARIARLRLCRQTRLKLGDRRGAPRAATWSDRSAVWVCCYLDKLKFAALELPRPRSATTDLARSRAISMISRG